MTVDYPAGKLRLDGYADLPPREPDSFFALGIGFEQVTSPPIHVTQVLPGSSAADEGIAVGDELVKVGGADFASLTPYQRPWAMIDQSEHTAVPVTVPEQARRSRSRSRPASCSPIRSWTRVHRRTGVSLPAHAVELVP
ncbi:MAG: PDZ domain-containing protein [Polyangiaceae bacterium]|nr:PDZ domain-containing protein [Polyangiaceae bacterium]